MLSFIYRLAVQFEKSHGVRPNLLYLHPSHFRQLKTGLDSAEDLERIMGLLQMDLVLDEEIVHPHVGWSPLGERRAG